MKLSSLLADLHRCEQKLAGQLTAMVKGHQADHEIHHVARDLLTWSEQHLRDLAAIGKNYDLDLTGGPAKVKGGKLLADLQQLYRTAADVSLMWELLGQAAHVVRDEELLALTQRCRPQTVRQLRWANAMLKVLSPQALAR